jgi:hypothetical protein
MSTEFNLERAIAGEPIETVAETPVEFIAYRPTLQDSQRLIVQVRDQVRLYYINGTLYSGNTPAEPSESDLRMKSVVRQIDWSKMPLDTLITLSHDRTTANRYFSSFNNGKVYYYRGGATSKTSVDSLDILTINPSNAQIAIDQPWTIWLGGDCPIPDGLEFEYMINDEPGKIMIGEEIASAYLCMWLPKIIYAYRLTGRVSDGWKL